VKVLELVTWEDPKSDEGLKKYHEFNEKVTEYWDERLKKHNVKRSVWSDGTGKIYGLYEFESYEAYAKFEDDEETQKIISGHFRLVNNGKRKVLREVISP